jgi:hypothetical protein
MKGTRTPKTDVYKFVNVRELIGRTFSEADNKAAKGTKQSFERYKAGRNDTEFIGDIANFEQYESTLKNGYEIGVQEFSTEARTEGGRLEMVPDVCGQFWDVGAYLSGNPECMGDFVEVEANNYKTIVIDATTPAKMPARKLAAKCKAVFEAVGGLEVSGTRCKVIIRAGVYNKKGNHIQVVELMVKDFEETLIPSYHGLILGNLSTVRGVIYSYMSLYNTRPNLGYAMPTQAQPGETMVSYLTDEPEQIKNKLS